MKRAIYGLVLAAVGCANPPPPVVDSAPQFAQQLAGKRYGFYVGPQKQAPIESGRPDEDYGYEGLRAVFQPLASVCARERGVVAVATTRVNGQKLPSAVTCEAPQGALWGVTVRYSPLDLDTAKNGGWAWLTLRTQFVAAADLAAAREQAETRRQAEAEAQRRDDLARREARERYLAALEPFRAGLKPATRVKWREPTSGFIGTGLVVRVDGELVQVQFDNLLFGADSVRHVRRAELEPWDGVPTGSRYQLR
ncbi:hypothetical protein J2X20_004076 [Pelomonas saccharophila]|uniref:Lipoprotein n=1 Tax=Roseateles saccharophilus TaxID=304 RepID=A0ABU1YRN0_ROSSA|nr:hypothetical protein [Roseateles saccharophilus]MDR7271408.1 hypothetical protein [Roseateles saccharophilus]